MKTEKTLVVAGLGRVDYALTAAIVARHIGIEKTELLCTSTAKLPVHLSELAAAADVPSAIVIAGIGLHAMPEELVKAARRLKEREVALTWISMVKLPDSMPPETSVLFEIHCDEGRELYRIAADLYGGDSGFYRKIAEKANEVGQISGGKPTSGKKQFEYVDFINACYHYYRNYQIKEPCYGVIRHLAACDDRAAWSEAEERIVASFLRSGHRELGGSSEAINELRRRIRIVAEREVPRVLICGESGTGKETVALLIHNMSSRGKESMISFNCASVSPQLLEARFLGCRTGAYTDASNRDGLFKMAQGSTLFLDEIGELPIDAQGLLLRALEEGRFYPLGGNQEEIVDIHLIAATNRNLAQMVAEGKFREDLYYRLNVVQLKVPPLRERLKDIKDIANNRWRTLVGRWLTDKEVEELKNYDYPGNVRELFAILERAAIFGDSFTKVIEEQRASQYSPKGMFGDMPDNLEEVVRLHINRVFEKCGRNVARAAEALGKSQNTVRKYLEGE